LTEQTSLRNLGRREWFTNPPIDLVGFRQSQVLLRFSITSLLLLIVAANSVRATTIVVARSANEIVIGADSKVTDLYGNDLNRRACKIRQVGNLFIAFEGLEVDRKTGFNVPEISTRALNLRPSGPMTEKISILTGFLVSELMVELSHLKTHEPDTYFKKIEGGQLFLRLIIAGFEKEKPLIFVRSFRALQFNPGQIGVSVIPDDCLDNCKGAVVTRFLGESEAIEGLPEETADFWKAGLSDGVRRLIETEIAARSEYVGPPIDIVRISKSGVQWIERKPECSEPRNSGKG
jgi:hypothetical protein